MDQKKVSQAINELLYDIQTRDVIKAKLVLKHLEEYEKKVWKRLLFELNRADDDFVSQVLASLAGEYPGVYQKFPVLEQILEAKALDNQSLIIDKLRPEKPGLASYIKLVGKLKLKKAVNPLESLQQFRT